MHANIIQDHNLLTDSAGLTDPENLDYLQKDFSLSISSPAYNQGIKVPVFEDFAGNTRSVGIYDVAPTEITSAKSRIFVLPQITPWFPWFSVGIHTSPYFLPNVGIPTQERGNEKKYLQP